MSLRERLIARAHEFAAGHYTKADRAELILEGARMALEDAAQGCGNEEIYPEERWGGIYNVAIKSCAAAIRTLRDGLE